MLCLFCPTDGYTIGEAIEHIGFGRFQAKLSLICGFAWVRDREQDGEREYDRKRVSVRERVGYEIELASVGAKYIDRYRENERL